MTDREKRALEAAVAGFGATRTCFAHVPDEFKGPDGVKPSDFRRLAKLGFLTPAQSVRGGGRRYYGVNWDKVQEVRPDLAR
jgi:hypothetical protein